MAARRTRQNNARRMTDGDITDLQVLSQIAWMDEFFLDDPVVAELINKGREFSLKDQQQVIAIQQKLSGQGPSGLCRGREARRD